MDLSSANVSLPIVNLLLVITLLSPLRTDHSSKATVLEFAEGWRKEGTKKNPKSSPVIATIRILSLGMTATCWIKFARRVLRQIVKADGIK